MDNNNTNTPAGSPAPSVGAAPAAAAPPAPAPALIALAEPPAPARTTGAMTTLRALVVQRVPALRSGRAIQTSRPANFEAWLGQTRGVVQGAACTHCTAGSGPWMDCVTVPGQFGGSCTNCHYGSEGARCSLRPARAPAPAPAPARAPARPPAGRSNVAVVLPSARRPAAAAATFASGRRPSALRPPAPPATTGRVRQSRGPGAQMEEMVRVARLLPPGGRRERAAALHMELAALATVDAEEIEEEEEEEEEREIPGSPEL